MNKGTEATQRAENAVQQLQDLSALDVSETIITTIVELEDGVKHEFERPISDVAFAAITTIKSLIAALEQAQQRIDELENDEVHQRLANAEHQLHMAELAKYNLRTSRRAQFRKRLEVEKRIAVLQQQLISPLSIGELLQRLENQNGQKWARQLSVKLPPRKTAADYTGGEFTNEHLAMIYNTCRLECSVRIKNAGGTVEGSE